MAKSVKMEVVMHDPGIFWSDNPYVYPESTFKSDNDNLSYAPFHCHIARDGKSDIEDVATAAHIIYGQSQAIKLGLGKSGSANKFNRISGSGLLFTATSGPPRKSKMHDLQGKDGDQQAKPCFLLETHNQIPHPTGVFLGRKTPDEFGIDTSADISEDVQAFFNSKARWCTPVGCQFKWSSRGTKGAAGAINFTRLALIYMDNWMPGRTLYMPLLQVKGESRYGEFVNPHSFYRGSDPLNMNYGSSASGDKDGFKYFGEIIAYGQPEIYDYLADPYTRAVCVGMYIELMQPSGQGAVYDICREIFDFKLLFDMPDNDGNLIATNSRFIYPAPHKLKDALDGNSIQFV